MTKISKYLHLKKNLTPSDLKCLTFYLDVMRNQIDIADKELESLYDIVQVVAEEPTSYLDDYAISVVYDVLDKLDELGIDQYDEGYTIDGDDYPD